METVLLDTCENVVDTSLVQQEAKIQQVRREQEP
jgi:hypothetical protein